MDRGSFSQEAAVAIAMSHIVEFDVFDMVRGASCGAQHAFRRSFLGHGRH
jgi:hypothetical protein